MADYFQNNLDGTPWDKIRSRTIASTRRGLALQLDGEDLMLQAPSNPPTVLASARLSQITLTVSGLAAKGSAVLVDFGSSTWMVDFGRVGARAMFHSGAAGKLKRFFAIGSLSSFKQGKALRDKFVDVMAAQGANLAADSRSTR